MMDPTGVHWIQAELVGLIKEKKLSDCIRTKQPQKILPYWVIQDGSKKEIIVRSLSVIYKQS